MLSRKSLGDVNKVNIGAIIVCQTACQTAVRTSQIA